MPITYDQSHSPTLGSSADSSKSISSGPDPAGTMAHGPVYRPPTPHPFGRQSIGIGPDYSLEEDDDAATTSTERAEQKEQEERAEQAYQLGRRLILQRAQAHLNTIAVVLQMQHNNGDDEKVERVRAELEKIVDGMNRD